MVVESKKNIQPQPRPVTDTGTKVHQIIAHEQPASVRTTVVDGLTVHPSLQVAGQVVDEAVTKDRRF